ncbi:MAG: energy transducer TonB [Gammaproteobacteria bacterium]
MSSLAFDSMYYPARRAAVQRVKPSQPKLVVVVPAKEARTESGYIPGPKKGALAGLVALAVVIHAAALYNFKHGGPAIDAKPLAKPVTISFAPPPPPPPPPPEPPKPRPQVLKTPTPAKPQPILPVVREPVSDGPADADTVQVATQPQPAPVQEAPPAPPPPPKPEPVSEPRGYAGYLKNPAPEYPIQAQERGQQGRVILKVHVLASGKPDSVTVEKSTGFKILDDAAVKAVQSWSFDPAKRGSTPIDGWVKVPLSFAL